MTEKLDYYYGERDASSGEETQAIAIAEREAGAVERVRAALVIAKNYPRDEAQGWHRLHRSCQRLRFAESASYTYTRGGSAVTGASIRLAEASARSLGNIQYGWDVMDTGPDWTSVEAWAMDMEANARASRTFRVRHYRDTKSGPRLLTAERDIYEMIASYAQRRLRACILQIVPRDIVEDALDACAETIRRGDDTPTEVRVRRMVARFGSLGITPEMLAEKQGRPLAQFGPDDLGDLLGVYNALQAGESKIDEAFGTAPIESKKDLSEGLLKTIAKKGSDK
jgi:hypothetical protein